MFNATSESSGITTSSRHDVANLGDRLLKLTLLINIALPAALFVVVYILRSMKLIPAQALVPIETLRILFFALVFVAVTELVTSFIVKKALFAPDKIRTVLHDLPGFAKLATGATITLAALGASAMMYGIVLYILGEDLTKVALFGLIALVHFRLFRPTAEFLRQTLDRAEMS